MHNDRNKRLEHLDQTDAEHDVGGIAEDERERVEESDGEDGADKGLLLSRRMVRLRVGRENLGPGGGCSRLLTVSGVVSTESSKCVV